MNRNLYLREMKSNAMGLLAWSIIIIALISVTMSIYPTFIKNQAGILGIINIVPKGALQFKGISNINDLISVMGFYSANNIIYMMLLGSIYSIVLGSNILLKEEYNKTAEFILSRPVTRSEVFLTKSAVVIINTVLLNFISAAAGFVWLELVKNEPLRINAFIVLSAYTLFLNLLFGITGLFISTLIRRARPVTASSVGLVLTLYFIFTLSKISPSISRLGYLSPFRYANADVINPDYKLDSLNMVYFIGLSIMLFAIAHYRYKQRDIYT